MKMPWSQQKPVENLEMSWNSIVQRKTRETSMKVQGKQVIWSNMSLEM